jgi:asparagine synthase (glutamine-hydrolysing)
MSGFVVLQNLDRAPADESRLVAMLGAMSHRGGDGVEIWMGDHVGLGIAFNRTTSESRFDRLIPPATEGRIVIAADARIDNRAELASALAVRYEEHADSALIALAYQKWGDRCLDHLIGDFAFALWDLREGRLFCARDHIGVKPFYYHTSDHHLLAASTINALFAGSATLARDLDEQRIAEYLVGSFDDVERTFYRDVKRLPASRMMTIAGGTLTRRRYATLDVGETIRLRSDAEYADAFRERFTEAVRARMRCTKPVGAALSGGLDSSSVVSVARAIARSEGAPRLHTYSIVFDDVPESDERPYIESVIAGGDLEPHFIRGDRTPPIPGIGTLYDYLEEPFYAPNMALHWEMFKAARASGVGVWLDGLDGDTTVSHGVAFLSELARQMRWLHLYREAAAFAVRHGLRRAKLLRSTMTSPLIDPIRRRRTARMAARSPEVSWQGSAINAELARRCWPVGLPSAPRPRTAVADHLHKLQWGLHPFLLESLDRAASAFGIEPRYPFYDRRLIEFSLALPPNQKLHDGWTRWVLRHAMQELLPTNVAWRTDKGNPAPSFMHTLRTFESARMRAMVGERASMLAPYVDIAALRGDVDRFLAGVINEREVMEIWKGLTLLSWLEHPAR